jgi:hypothetical protein
VFHRVELNKLEIKKRVMVEHKKLKDGICFDITLFAKYKSLIDEMASTDFDIYSKKGFFHEVVNE